MVFTGNVNCCNFIWLGRGGSKPNFPKLKEKQEERVLSRIVLTVLYIEGMSAVGREKVWESGIGRERREEKGSICNS